MKKEDHDKMDERNIEELDATFNKADDIVTKKFLSFLDSNIIIKDLDREINIENTAGLYEIKKIVYDPFENNLQKTVNTYSSAVGLNCDIVMLIISDGKSVNIYLGTTGAHDTSSARSKTKAFVNNFIGNFPGCDATELDNYELKQVVAKSTADSYSGISVVSGVGSVRDKEEKDNKAYIQGIEKMIDAMQGKKYSAIFIANVIGRDRLEDIKAEYELLYSKLVPFLKSELSFNVSSAKSLTHTLSKSVTESVTKSSSSALSVGTSKSNSHTEGNSQTHSDSISLSHSRSKNLNLGTPYGGGGKGSTNTIGYSHTYSRTKSWSDTATFGESKSRTKTAGKTKARGKTDTKSEGNTKTESTGRGLQITYLNKTIQQLLDKIDEQLERIKESENYGIFSTAAYFLAENLIDSQLAASSYKSLINGLSTHVETAYINAWNEDLFVSKIKKYLRVFRHPEFMYDESNCVTPASIVSGKELAVQMSFPQRSVPGVSVMKIAPFGINRTEKCNKNKQIDLGTIFHMGKKLDLKVALNSDSFAMHTFITGSTGSGKSNTVYTILNELKNIKIDDPKSNKKGDTVKFLVIEPAKGEYKNIFGARARVYGTNDRLTELLRLNPFSFPDGIHVFEHLDRLVEIFNVCWPMYAAMPAILKDAIERAYAASGWDLQKSVNKYGSNFFPTFTDVLNQINAVLDESQYSADNKGDYKGSLCTRLRSLTNGINGMIFTNNAISDKDLFDENVIVDLSRIGSSETKSLIMGVLVMKLQEYRMVQDNCMNSNLRHITVLEEAHNLLKRTSIEQSSEGANLIGKSVEMLTNAIAEMRTYGEGFIIADQAPGLLDMAVIRNTNTKIIMRLPEYSDRELVGRAASLNDEQIVELAKLETGVAAVYQNDWIEPVLCKVTHYEKSGQYKKPDLENKMGSPTSLGKKEILQIILSGEIYRKNDRIDNIKSDILNSDICTSAKCSYLEFINAKTAEEAVRPISRFIYEAVNASEVLSKFKYNGNMDYWKENIIREFDLLSINSSSEAINRFLSVVLYEQSVRDPEYGTIFKDYKELYRKEGGIL